MTTDNLAKWVDELAGTIERIQKKISTFKVNTVEVDPVTENTGFKIADITVNGEKSTLKMVDISVTPEEDNDGDKIGEITINGETTELNMPEIDFEPEFDEGTKLATFTLGEHAPTEIYAPKAPWVVSVPSAVVKHEIANSYGTPLYEAYIRVQNVLSGSTTVTLIDAETEQSLLIGNILEFSSIARVEDTNNLSKGKLFSPLGTSTPADNNFQFDRVVAGITLSSSFVPYLTVGFNAPSGYVADFIVKIVYTETGLS